METCDEEIVFLNTIIIATDDVGAANRVENNAKNIEKSKDQESILFHGLRFERVKKMEHRLNGLTRAF